MKFGHGAQLLVALHGFSDRARMFAVLEKTLADRFTIVAIDLPFHGQTEWNKRDFSKGDLLRIIAQLLEAEGRTRCSLMGFSFGARLAQAMLPEFVSILDHLYLLSPDGVNTKGLDAAERTPMWVRRLLFRMLKHPAGFVSIADLGKNWGLVPAFTHKFITNNLNRPKRIQRLFGCWFSMDSFKVLRLEIPKILRETGLPTEVYLGANDTLVDKKSLKKLFKDLPNVHFNVLKNEGHRIVGKQLAAAIGSRQ